MTDIILTVRLGIDDNRKNKKLFSAFARWLDIKYAEHAQNFIQNILNSAQIPFDGAMTTQPEHSLENDVYEEFRHPKLGKGGKWFLDDLQMKNKHAIWIKLENHWLKGIIEIRRKTSNIVIEPEKISIPISKNMFLRW